MRYYVGIDPASESFVASIFVPPDEKLSGTGPREFSNDAEGFESFRSWLTSHEQLAQSDTLVCVEQTGVYSEALCYNLRRAGFEIVLLDPHAVWKAFKDERKTDELDSRRIGEYGYRYRDQPDRWTLNETVAEQVKTLLTAREQLDKQKTATQNGPPVAGAQGRPDPRGRRGAPEDGRPSGRAVPKAFGTRRR